MTNSKQHATSSGESSELSSKDVDFWSASRYLRSEKPEETGMPEPGDVALLGPPRSGKSSFLMSLGRLFETGQHPDWKRFVPSSKGFPGTTYTFQLGMSTAGDVTDEEMEVSVQDTPGDFFNTLAAGKLAEEGRKHNENLLRATLNARCLVLCCPASGGKMDVTGVVGALLTRGPRRLKRMGAKPWPQRESPWQRVPRLELPFERVLILFTGIEALCNEIFQQLKDQDRARSSPDSADEPHYRGLEVPDLADLLDFWALAKHRVNGLSLLQSSLKPGAQLAVCGVSPGAVEETESMPDTSGRMRSFGIWPALLFMITGRVVDPLSTSDQRSAEVENWIRLDVPSNASGDQP